MTVSPQQMRQFLRIVENADFDRGHGDLADTFSLGGRKGPFDDTMKGRAETRTRRMNARYGDNAMKDVSEPVAEAPFGHPDGPGAADIPDPQSSIVDRLQAMLQKAGIADDEIRAGIDLTAAGKQKVAARLGISADEVTMLLGSLTTRLRDDEKHAESAYESAYRQVMDEAVEDQAEPAATGTTPAPPPATTAPTTPTSGARFSYEKDSAGNVTVRDAQTGKSVYLQGSQATDLLSRLAQQPSAVQSILGSLTSLMETAKGAGGSFLDEMTQDQGIFNFSWHDSGQHGTGTARFHYDGQEFHIKLLSVRDHSGQPMRPDPAMMARLETIARDFIADENE